jgi:hypothetical protein
MSQVPNSGQATQLGVLQTNLAAAIATQAAALASYKTAVTATIAAQAALTAYQAYAYGNDAAPLTIDAGIVSA